MSLPAIVLFGDSLTEQAFSLERGGFGAALANSYARRADVLNRGLSGYNSSWLISYLQSILAAQVSTILLWVILVGTNDACLPGFVHHVPLEQYKENLRAMINAIMQSSKNTGSKILLVTPPPIDWELLHKHGPRGGADRDAAVTREYANAMRLVYEEFPWSTVGLVDFHSLMEKRVSEGALLKDFLTDGVHLDKPAYKILFDAIIQQLEPQFPELLPRNLPMKAPWWGDLRVVEEFKAKHERGNDELEHNGSKHDEL